MPFVIQGFWINLRCFREARLSGACLSVTHLNILMNSANRRAIVLYDTDAANVVKQCNDSERFSETWSHRIAWYHDKNIVNHG